MAATTRSSGTLSGEAAISLKLQYALRVVRATYQLAGNPSCTEVNSPFNVSVGVALNALLCMSTRCCSCSPLSLMQRLLAAVARPPLLHLRMTDAYSTALLLTYIHLGCFKSYELRMHP
jgi:hypothetical protein